jgi:hypothetical protein
MCLKFRRFGGSFAICRLPSGAPIPESNAVGHFMSITRTEDELTIVCLADQAPDNTNCEAPWICLKLEGPFPFSQTGVLASFIDPLAERGIPCFAISTFDTDCVLIKEEFAATALGALQDAGHALLLGSNTALQVYRQSFSVHAANPAECCTNSALDGWLCFNRH